MDVAENVQQEATEFAKELTRYGYAVDEKPTPGFDGIPCWGVRPADQPGDPHTYLSLAGLRELLLQMQNER